MMRFDSFNSAYIGLAKKIRDEYEYLSSPRGMNVKEALCVSFEITDPRDRYIYIPHRKWSASYTAAEVLWYFLGIDRTDWISYYAPFWNDISDDGVTANSAYGARIFEKHPRIAKGRLLQWQYVIDELKRDPDSRRAVIHIRTPDDSIHAKKDVPCTLALQFFIRNGKLDLVVNMRSSDLILGIAYDIPAFTLMQEAMSIELGVDMGRYLHNSNSLHVYERHFEMLDKIANEDPTSYKKRKANPLPKSWKSRFELLGLLEKDCRSAQTEDDISAIIKRAQSFSIEPMMFDILLSLLHHKAKKIGVNHSMLTEMMSETIRDTFGDKR